MSDEGGMARSGPIATSAIFGALPGPYLLLDADLRIVDATITYLDATMTVRDEIVGRNLFDVFPDNPDDPDSDSGRNMRASLARVLALGVTDVMPLARHDVAGPDGRFVEKYWSPTNTPVLGDGGAVTHVIHHVDDVTATIVSAKAADREGASPAMDAIGRHREIAALNTELIETTLQKRQSDQTLRQYLDFAPAVISARDREGRLILRNRRFDDRFLRSGDTRAADAQASVVTPALSAQVESLEQQVFETGEAVTGESGILDDDGRDLLFAYTKFPLRTPTGEIYAVGTIATDITEARHATEALRSSEERFKQMAEHSPDVFLLWEEHSLEMLYISPMLEAMLGIGPETFQDPVARLAIAHPDDLDLVMSPPAPLKEFRIIKPGGAVRWIRSASSLIETPAGMPDRGVTTFTDVTDRKEAELAAVAARAEAEHANEAKSEFLSRMSHELRTPLHAIMGFSQLLAVEGLSPEHREAVEHIHTAGEHLLGLVDEVLDISRAETGDLRLSLEPVSLDGVVEEVVGMLAPIAATRQVHMTVTASAEPVHVRADRQRLKQVIVNLIDNAIKYNRRDGQVRLTIAPAGDGRVRLTVTDTGRGISDHDVERLFRPFERLAADDLAVSGTGLGLVLTQHLVQAMGGAIGVTSTAGQGTCFWVELPTARPSAVEAHEAAHPPPPLAAPRAGRPKTVLCVEDNAANVRLIGRILDLRPDVRLVVATLGRAALELAAEHQPDLILLDLHLSDVSGEEVLHDLRSDERTQDIPVVVVSADASPRRSAQLLALGATGYLAKPFDIEGFLAVIDRVDDQPTPPTPVR